MAEQRTKMIAASKLSALGEMAGGLAHEINTPLMVIRGYARQIRLMRSMTEEIQRDVIAKAGQIEDTTGADLKNHARPL